MDREKVMSWLECLAEPDWRDFHSDSEVQNIAKSAIELLKAQRETIDELISADKALKLMKEQEAIEPICQIIFDVPYYFCGSCKTMLNMYAVKAKYCSNCARRVKWKKKN